MKICLVCSHGGHLTQGLQLQEAFNKNEVFIVTYHSSRDDEIRVNSRAYFIENMGAGIWNMLKGSMQSLGILFSERPKVIISLGAEIAIPFFYIGKLIGSKTLYIESWSRVENLSLTGKIVYPVSDEFWVQWPQLLHSCGPKAKFNGSVI